MQPRLSAVWGVALLLALHGVRMVSAQHNCQAPQSMFVFGDSFVDNGNLPRTDPAFEMSRQFYYPYGVSSVNDDGSAAQAHPTGRFSDFMVQSDLIANMLGLPRSPPAFQTSAKHYCAPSGMNFAFGDAAVYRFEFRSTTIREQVNIFKEMIDSGTISHNHVTHSIALLAVSGYDYKRFRNNKAFIRNVTTEIAANVARLRSLGVQRVLVNNLHPLGCTPLQTRRNDYDACDDSGNKDASVHNEYLTQKLGAKKGVFILDLNTAFGNIMGRSTAESSDLDKQFNQSLRPCCISDYPEGYCGQQDKNSEPLYSLCADPSRSFFWDEMNPTHAGWEAIMKQLEDPIKEFIGQGRIEGGTSGRDAPTDYLVAL